MMAVLAVVLEVGHAVVSGSAGAALGLVAGTILGHL